MTGGRTGSVVAAAATAGGVAVAVGASPWFAGEVVLGVAVLAWGTRLLAAVPRPRRPARRRPPPAPDRHTRARMLLAAASRSRWSTMVALRPAVEEVVAARLAAVHGVSLSERSPAVVAHLPPAVRTLIEADPRTTDRRGPGLDLATIDRLLTELEEL